MKSGLLSAPRGYVGLSDGAKDNWIYLDAVTPAQVVDLYHVTTYLWGATQTLFAGTTSAEMCPWIDARCHRLDHEEGSAAALIAELETRGAALGGKRLSDALARALTYLRNQSKGAGRTTRGCRRGTSPSAAGCKVLVSNGCAGRRCPGGIRAPRRC